jgi:hypothetical protein
MPNPVPKFEGFAPPSDGPNVTLSVLRTGFGCFRERLRGSLAERTKLECRLESGGGTAKLSQPTRIVTNCYRCDNSPQSALGFLSILTATKVGVSDLCEAPCSCLLRVGGPKRCPTSD